MAESGEDEESDAGGGAVVLVDEDVEVFVGGEGDEGVEVEVGELVLESEGVFEREEGGEMGAEGGERGEGAAVDGEDAGFAAGVEEGVGAGTGEYVAAVAAHETELGGGFCRVHRVGSVNAQEKLSFYFLLFFFFQKY